MATTETTDAFINRFKELAQFDVDVKHCQENGIKFKNNEKDTKEIELFTSKSNIAAFNFIAKLK